MSASERESALSRASTAHTFNGGKIKQYEELTTAAFSAIALCVCVYAQQSLKRGLTVVRSLVCVAWLMLTSCRLAAVSCCYSLFVFVALTACAEASEPNKAVSLCEQRH